jgi:G3E family GTPase
MSSRWTSEALTDRLFPSARPAPFGRAQKRPRGARTPVVVVTGFLGAGKTTLVKRFLASPEGAGTAVVVNEFGEIGIDDALLRGAADKTVLLGNGCLCCVARSDLETTLQELLADARLGRVPTIERVLIETSGLADPLPILQTFVSDRGIGRELAVDLVVAVVDAVGGAAMLAAAPEARRQVALADRVIVSKRDLADADAEEAVRAAIAAVNPRAEIVVAVAGAVPAETWAPAPIARSAFQASEAVHSEGVASFVLPFPRPVTWPAFAQALDAIVALRGEDVLRMKGLVAVDGLAGPLVVQVVRHLVHPPVELLDWPDEDRSGRLVVIGRNLDASRLAAVFAALQAL